MDVKQEIANLKRRVLALEERASPNVLTVGQALREAPAIEFVDGDGDWQQLVGGRRRWWRGYAWSGAGAAHDPHDDDRPCRLVPRTHADSDPNIRGPL